MMWLCLAAGLSGWRVVEGGWVDGDTPKKARTIKSLVDGRRHELVFSDEFEHAGRRFDDGSDPRWTAIHKNDYTNAALHFYHKDYARTTGGMLNLTTTSEDIKFESIQVEDKKFVRKKLTKHYRSAMLQSWNKFCFTGGIVEISAQLPGRHDVGGLWPAMWFLGNLARSTYVHSSDYIWPWSWGKKCDREEQPRQRINACSPQPHYGLHPFQGRGSPEIDLLEVMPGSGGLPWGMRKPYFSTSFQVAPGKKEPRPQNGNMPAKGGWYEGMEYNEKLNTSINVFFYGMTLEHAGKGTSYTADAISANTPIGQSEFSRQHKYRLEWDPDPEGSIRWFKDDVFIYTISYKSLELTGANIPDEPMYILFNTALSSTWGFPPIPLDKQKDCDCFDCKNPKCACALAAGFCDSLPAHFLIDYVRVYQPANASRYKVGCSTDTHPTRKWIEAHRDEFSDPDSGSNEPLQKVPSGGAKCAGGDCGRGKCRHKRCDCNGEWTGPKCESPLGFDDFPYDLPPPFSVMGIYLPPALPRVVAIPLLFFAFLVIFDLYRRKASSVVVDSK